MIAELAREIGGWPFWGVAVVASVETAVFEICGLMTLKLVDHFTDMLPSRHRAWQLRIAIAAGALAFIPLALAAPKHALAAAAGVFGYYAAGWLESWAQT